MLRSLTLFLATMLVGCAAEMATGERPVDPSRPIAFIDSDVFDNDVARTLAVAPEKVTVTTVSPMTVNALPPRLNAWMAAVQGRGGNVQMIGRDPNAAQQQQFVSLLLPILSTALSGLFPDKADVRQYIRENRTYAHADGYDMQIVYVPGTGTIHEILFTRK
jgi:hypothetical protein